MDWSSVAAAGTAAAGGLALQVWRASGAKDAIKSNLEILALLPHASEQRAPLMEHIDNQVAALIERDVHARRDPPGIVAAALLVVGAVYCFLLGHGTQGWARWGAWVFGAVVLTIGCAGLVTSVPKQRRDDKGNAVKEP